MLRFVRKQGSRSHFRGANFVNSLYFSLLAGSLGGEGLARDCALRHYLRFQAFFRIVSAVAQPERDLIRGRVSAGVRNARASGKQLGRPRRIVSQDEIIRLKREGALLVTREQRGRVELVRSSNECIDDFESTDFESTTKRSVAQISESRPGHVASIRHLPN